jgi:hypothetical protein
MVGDHPTIRQVDILMKLNRHHLGVNLDDHAFQPTADSFFILVIMVAKHLHNIADTVVAIFFRRR